MNIHDTVLQVEIDIGTATRRRRPERQDAPDPPVIPRITRLMALAIKFQDMVDRGKVLDYADLARLGHVSRARITQIMNLLNLVPEIQEELLFSNANPSLRFVISEHGLRGVSQSAVWEDQIMAFRAL